MATIILKATEKCNSNCYYCDVVYRKGKGKSMPLHLLEIVFIRINDFLETYPEEKVEIIWHGGEPLLLGPAYYDSALDFQERHCSGTKDRIHHSIQTNLTCYSREFSEIFRRMGIGAVGTSYDPEPYLRGPGRPINSNLYNRLFMKNLRQLEQDGYGWGMIYVVTKRSLAKPLDIFFFLTNLLLTGGIMLNPVLIYDDERQDIAITPEEFTEFLGAIFPMWWKYRYRYPDMEPFRSLVANIVDGKRALGCADSGECTYNHVNIAPDGETSQCGRSGDWNILPYGNIQDRSLYEILHDPQRDQFKERVEKLRDSDCKKCRFFEICHGGCPLDSYSTHKNFFHKSEWCESKRGFIEKYFEPITGVRFERRNQKGPRR